MRVFVFSEIVKYARLGRLVYVLATKMKGMGLLQNSTDEKNEMGLLQNNSDLKTN